MTKVSDVISAAERPVELAGRLVWNRRQWLKDPDSGRRRYVDRPREEWQVREVPELRIVPAELDTDDGSAAAAAVAAATAAAAATVVESPPDQTSNLPRPPEFTDVDGTDGLPSLATVTADLTGPDQSLALDEPTPPCTKAPPPSPMRKTSFR